MNIITKTLSFLIGCVYTVLHTISYSDSRACRTTPDRSAVISHTTGMFLAIGLIPSILVKKVNRRPNNS